MGGERGQRRDADRPDLCALAHRSRPARAADRHIHLGQRFPGQRTAAGTRQPAPQQLHRRRRQHPAELHAVEQRRRAAAREAVALVPGIRAAAGPAAGAQSRLAQQDAQLRASARRHARAGGRRLSTSMPATWRPIALANGIDDPRRLTPGAELTIPVADRRPDAMPGFTTLYDESIDPANRDFYAPAFETADRRRRSAARGAARRACRSPITTTSRRSTGSSSPSTTGTRRRAALQIHRLGDDRRPRRRLATRSKLFRLFEPGGKSVEVALGYVGDLQLVLRATFTTMEPSFPGERAAGADGARLNMLHRLRTKQFTYAWTNRSPSAIALNFNSLRDGSQPRLPSGHGSRHRRPGGGASRDRIRRAEEPVRRRFPAPARARRRVRLLEADEDAQELYFGPSHELDRRPTIGSGGARG